MLTMYILGGIGLFQFGSHPHFVKNASYFPREYLFLFNWHVQFRWVNIDKKINEFIFGFMCTDIIFLNEVARALKCVGP
jgi:hypothetical protein